MISGSIIISGPPTVTVDLIWDINMDNGSLPPLAVWQFVIDGTPTPASAQVWFAANVLRVSYAGSDPTVTGLLNLITTDPGLHSSGGAVARAPQTVQFFP